MFFSFDRLGGRSASTRKKAFVGTLVATLMVSGGAITAFSNPSVPSEFPAQGGRWSPSSDVTGSPYVLKSPNVGTGEQFQTPVYYGVRAWQELLNDSGAKLTVDGAYGPKTKAAVASFQSANGLEPTGVVGRPTAKLLLDAVVERNAKRTGVPAKTLMCHMTAESNLDASAVGLNGSDMGIAQISLIHNPGVTTEQAFDVNFAIEYMADRNAKAFKKYGDWRYAIADYNSPALAREWSRTGKPADRVAKYSDRVLNSCSL